jgi:hypothetical protein
VQQWNKTTVVQSLFSNCRGINVNTGLSATVLSISNKNGTTRKGAQSDTVLREMMIEATFNQTNCWLILFSILWHKVWVLIYIMFIFEKVGHSRFGCRYFHKWYVAKICGQHSLGCLFKINLQGYLNFAFDQREIEVNLHKATSSPSNVSPSGVKHHKPSNMTL